MLRALVVFVSVPVLAASIFAQTGGVITPEIRAAANKAYQEKNWHEAAEAYKAITKLEEKNAGAHYRLGMSLLGVRKNEEAVLRLEVANQLSPNPIFALGLAKAYATLAKDELMYATFEKVIALGGVPPESIESDHDFARFRTEAKFKEVVRKCRLRVFPCEARPEFRQFDFWIGEWLPKNAQGLTVGTSSIQLILGSCVIFENWNTPVSSGKSFSNFSTADGKWHQTWVDDKGTLAYYTGGLVDGKMVLDSERVVNGKKTISRMTFTKLDNGDVRQHGGASTDDGKTWTPTFDFTYIRKK
ncbi:MAG TPA: hypothetical protein VJ781_04945 [Pyrinomonadaceae bacterium]|jgi:hypothetical protein|nr:hypothetical protein [Pyrinomonadaceae bacterium]